MNAPGLIRNAGRYLSPILPSASARLAETLATQPRRRTRSFDPPGTKTVTLRFGLRALRWGDTGPVVLALHGWEGGPHQFQAIGKGLAERGFQLFALTGPGHDNGPDRIAHPGLFADSVQEAAAELGPMHALIGHSMGAGAILLAQIGGLMVERSVCLAGPAGYRGVLERIADQLGLAPGSRARFLQRMETRTGLPLDETHPSRVLGKIDGRLLIVHDRDDPVVPFADAEEIIRHGGERAALMATRGLGHGRILKNEAVVEAIGQFLNS
jgi:pimeloyl-ACP methyl ester carboxylesterase